MTAMMPEEIETKQHVVQAESKAADAASRLEELLQRTSTAWLPLWLEMHYNKVQTQYTAPVTGTFLAAAG